MTRSPNSMSSKICMSMRIDRHYKGVDRPSAENRTIDWQKKESARAGMRKLVKQLLKRHKYPLEGMDDAVHTMLGQCEI